MMRTLLLLVLTAMAAHYTNGKILCNPADTGATQDHEVDIDINKDAASSKDPFIDWIKDTLRTCFKCDKACVSKFVFVRGEGFSYIELFTTAVEILASCFIQ